MFKSCLKPSLFRTRVWFKKGILSFAIVVSRAMLSVDLQFCFASVTILKSRHIQSKLLHNAGMQKIIFENICQKKPSFTQNKIMGKQEKSWGRGQVYTPPPFGCFIPAVGDGKIRRPVYVDCRIASNPSLKGCQGEKPGERSKRDTSHFTSGYSLSEHVVCSPGNRNIIMVGLCQQHLNIRAHL